MEIDEFYPQQHTIEEDYDMMIDDEDNRELYTKIAIDQLNGSLDSKWAKEPATQ